MPSYADEATASRREILPKILDQPIFACPRYDFRSGPTQIASPKRRARREQLIWFATFLRHGGLMVLRFVGTMLRTERDLACVDLVSRGYEMLFDSTSTNTTR